MSDSFILRSAVAIKNIHYSGIEHGKYYYFWIMKTKRFLNISLIITGLLIMSIGPEYLGTELALALGFPFLMLGLYRVSKKAQPQDESGETQSDEV
jgi:hypothetical protein